MTSVQALSQPIQGMVHDLDSNEAVSKIRTMDQVVEHSAAPARFLQ